MNLRKKIFVILILSGLILVPYISFSQIKTYPFEQIDSLQKVERRNIVVFIHTEWCKYCQAMQNTTFKNDNVAKLFNESFYFIALNAEEKKDIVFNGRTFKYKPTGVNTGFHELAEQLANLDKQVAYPTLCFLNSNNEINFQYNQFINAPDLATILTRLKL